MFLSEDEEQPMQIGCPQISGKPVLIPTYATQSLTPSSFNMVHPPSFLRLVDSPATSADISIEQQIFRGNAQILRTAVIQYLKICLGENFYEIRGGVPKTILNQNDSLDYDDEESILELITSKNRVFSHETQIKICNIIEQFQEISSFFKQLKQLLGSTLTQEFAFILANILTLKIQSFKRLKDHQAFDIIPQMERFWGDQGDQKFVSSGWEVYQDVDYSLIKSFSVEKIEEMASKLYYSSSMEYLNLSKAEISNSEASDKFSALVCLFSETLFLTMSGFRQQQADLQEFLQQIRMDMSSGQVQYENPVKRTKLE